MFAPARPEGTRRTPLAGRTESAASDRMVIHEDEDGLARSTNGPTNVSPALKRIVSPGAAASIAGCSVE